MDLVIKLKAENEALKSKVEQLEKLNNWYVEQLKLRQKEKFGKSSEKTDDNQISLFDLFNEAETLQQPFVQEPREEILVKEHKKKKAKRGTSFSNLPVEIIEYQLPEEEQICDICGSTLTEMKKEIRKEIKIIPAQVSIVEHVTYHYSCRVCDKEGVGGFIKAAESPKALFPKSMVSPSLLAYIINQKYTNAMPLYRQEQEFGRLGVFVSRQNLSQWVLKAARMLKPLEEALKKQLLTEPLLHADETTLEVLKEPGREANSKSYMWLYRTSKSREHPVILYDYQVGRSGDYAKAYLADWKGQYLHCDGFAGYKKVQNVTLCGCLVHAKRKFHEAWNVSKDNEDAKKWEVYLQKLFLLEHKADEAGYDEQSRLQMRQTQSAGILEEFYNWLGEISLKTLPQSLLGKAITYAQNQKEYLCKFIKDPRIQLSNNLAEQSIKMFVIGRKNFLFSNTPNGASGSATLYGIIQTAIANDIKPLYYLEYVLEQLQKNPITPIELLLPWSEAIPEKCKNKKVPQA